MNSENVILMMKIEVVSMIYIWFCEINKSINHYIIINYMYINIKYIY